MKYDIQCSKSQGEPSGEARHGAGDRMPFVASPFGNDGVCGVSWKHERDFDRLGCQPSLHRFGQRCTLVYDVLRRSDMSETLFGLDVSHPLHRLEKTSRTAEET